MRRDGDEFIFDPDTRRLANEARGSNGSCDNLLEAALAVWAGRAPGVKKVTLKADAAGRVSQALHTMS